MICQGRSLPTLVILGAGATRGASFVRPDPAPQPPLDADFFKQLGNAATPGSLVAQAKEQLDDAVAGAGLPSYGDAKMEEYFIRAEFTKALRVHMATSGADDKPGRRGNFAEPVVAYRKAIAALIAETTASRNCAYHRAIADTLEPGDTVITFNYDTVMDTAMEDASSNAGKGCEVDLGLRDIRLRSVRNALCEARRGGKAFLLHLHGCLSWRVGNMGVPPESLWSEPPDAHPCHLDERRQLGNDGDLNYERITSVELLQPGDGPEYDLGDMARRFIVPPLWTKPIARCQLLENLWAIARMALRKCKRLVIIGYSLPPADQLTNYLVEVDANVNSSERLEELVLVDRSGCVRERIVNKLADTKKAPAEEAIVEYRGIKQFAESLSRGQASTTAAVLRR